MGFGFCCAYAPYDCIVQTRYDHQGGEKKGCCVEERGSGGGARGPSLKMCMVHGWKSDRGAWPCIGLQIEHCWSN